MSTVEEENSKIISRYKHALEMWALQFKPSRKQLGELFCKHCRYCLDTGSVRNNDYREIVQPKKYRVTITRTVAPYREFLGIDFSRELEQLQEEYKFQSVEINYSGEIEFEWVVELEDR